MFAKMDAPDVVLKVFNFKGVKDSIQSNVSIFYITVDCDIVLLNYYMYKTIRLFHH